MDQLVKDPSLIPNAIEELLRYEAPSPVQARYVAIAVMLHINGSANRDELKFEDLDRFNICRKLDHLTYGQGIHFWLGNLTRNHIINNEKGDNHE